MGVLNLVITILYKEEIALFRKENLLSYILILYNFVISFIMFYSETTYMFFSRFYNPIVFIITMSPTILSFVFLKLLDQNLVDIKLKLTNFKKSILISLGIASFLLFMVVLADGINNISFVPLSISIYIFLLALQEEIVFRGFLEKNLNFTSTTTKEIILYLSWSGVHIFRSIYYSSSIDSVFFLIHQTLTIRLLFYLTLRYIIRKTDNLWGAVNLHFLNNLIFEMLV